MIIDWEEVENTGLRKTLGRCSFCPGFNRFTVSVIHVEKKFKSLLSHVFLLLCSHKTRVVSFNGCEKVMRRKYSVSSRIL